MDYEFIENLANKAKSGDQKAKEELIINAFKLGLVIIN